MVKQGEKAMAGYFSPLQGYSVIMAARPHENFISEALDSICRQTLPPAEIIVCINGPGGALGSSTAVARSYGDIVETIFSEKPSQPNALNSALRRVSRPLVAVLDADDLWVTDKQETQLEILRARPELDAVSCLATNFSGTGASLQSLKTVNTAMCSAVTFRTQTFTQFGFFDGEADQHAWLYRWWSAARHAGIQTVSSEKVGLWRRVHNNNGWLHNQAKARSELHAELRRIHHTRVGRS